MIWTLISCGNSSNLDVFLNRWFSTYEEARRSLESEGGFLLPYRRHFFVCEADVIKEMGLEPDDPGLGKDREGTVPNPATWRLMNAFIESGEQVVRDASTESLAAE